MLRLNEHDLQALIDKKIGTRFIVAIAHGEVAPTNLSQCERSCLLRVADTPRRASWLAGRSALKLVLSRLGEGADTCCLSFPHRRFSLTHSQGWAVAVGTQSDELLGVGIDLELKRSPSPQSARFFLTESEQRSIRTFSSHDQTTELLRLWTVKEAVFKADPDNGGHILPHYWLPEPQARTGIAFKTDRLARFAYWSFKVGHGFLSIALLPRGQSHVIRQ